MTLINFWLCFTESEKRKIVGKNWKLGQNLHIHTYNGLQMLRKLCDTPVFRPVTELANSKYELWKSVFRANLSSRENAERY
jgi:hypothetical protein